ncbi:MAG: ceramidase domain-containing protein [Chitinophagales bacterium]
MQTVNKQPIVFIIPLLVAIVSLTLFFIALNNAWFGTHYITFPFCETYRNHLIKQPANTWSNLGFVLVGLRISYESMQQKYVVNNNLFSRTKFYPVFYSCLAVLLGPGSMAMHASSTYVGGYFDMLSMYLLASFMFAYAMTRFFKLNEFYFFILYVIAITLCHLGFFYNDSIRQISIFKWLDVNAVFGIFIGIGSLLEFAMIKNKASTINGKFAIAFASAFGLAFLIWNLSLTGNIGCYPDSLIQGHAIWHILCAVSVYYIFRFYSSENYINQ